MWNLTGLKYKGRILVEFCKTYKIHCILFSQINDYRYHCIHHIINTIIVVCEFSKNFNIASKINAKPNYTFDSDSDISFPCPDG